MRRQIFGRRIVQRDFAVLNHVGQKQGSEQLGKGGDFEHRVAVQRAIRRIRPSGRDDALCAPGDDAGDDAGAFARVDFVLQKR